MTIRRSLLTLAFGVSLPVSGFTLGKQGLDWRSLLSSTNQHERDAAAQKSRAVFKPTKKDVWVKKLSWIAPKLDLAALEAKLVTLGIAASKSLGGDCSGGSCSRIYRLDDCFVLTVWYSTQHEQIITSEIHQGMESFWVSPPPDFSGTWIVYFANGNKSHEISYKDGKYFGDFLSYHPNGRISVKQSYSTFGIEGEEIGYYPTGKIAYRGSHSKGKDIGKWVWFDEAGSVKSEKNHPEHE